MAAAGIGGIFQGIGDTFKAGSNAHQALINERNVQRNLQFQREALNEQGYVAQLSAVLNLKSQESRLITTVVIGALAITSVVLIFRR